MAKSSPTPERVQCEICGKSINRKADLARHMKIHAANKKALMISCPYKDSHGCKYEALQQSNIDTHVNTHTLERPHECPHKGCRFAAGDPSSLTRHRRKIHGYVPQPHAPRRGRSVAKQNAARQQRRHNPYTRSASSSGPVSPSHADSPSSLSHPNSEEGSRSSSVECTTELTTELAQNASLGTAVVSGSPTLSEEPALEIPEEIHATAQPVCNLAVAEEILDNFLLKFGGWQDTLSLPSTSTSLVSYGADSVPAAASRLEQTTPHATVRPVSNTTCEVFDDFLSKSNNWQTSIPSHHGSLMPYDNISTSTTLPQFTLDATTIAISPAQSLYHNQYDVPNPPASMFTMFPQYTLNDAVTATSAVLPPYHDQCTGNDAPAPAPASIPRYGAQYVVDNAPYEYRGYTTEAAPLYAQPSHSSSFAFPDADVYPRAINYRDAYSGYSDSTYARANSFSFGI